MTRSQILLHMLEHLIDIKRTILSWFKSYFINQSRFVSANNESSMHVKVSDGIPHGSVLESILLYLYMFPSGNIILKRYSFSLLHRLQLIIFINEGRWNKFSSVTSAMS